MGKQISFVMTKADEQLFLTTVLSSEKVKVLRHEGRDFDSMIMANPLQEIFEEDIGQVHFWNTNFEMRETDLFVSGSQEKRDPGVYYAYVNEVFTQIADPFSEPVQDQSKSSIFIRSSEAPTIEYIRPFFKLGDGRFRKARIWMEKNRLVDMQFEYKGEAFEKWYESTANWIRRHFHYVAEHYAYFGPDVLAWYRTEGKGEKS